MGDGHCFGEGIMSEDGDVLDPSELETEAILMNRNYFQLSDTVK